MTREKLLFTSESVSMGHPDKIADQISDAILDGYLREDAHSRVACETLVTTGLVIVAGEVTSKGAPPIQDLVRETIREIGYTDAGMGFHFDTCAVMTALDRQSPDIARGVDAHDSREQGAGDQGLMFGFACDETPELMPLSIRLAHRLMEEHARSRTSGEIPFLRPDAKTQVTVEYDNGVPARVDTVVLSTHHREDVSPEQIREEIIEKLIRRHIPAQFLDDKTRFFINPTGRFVTGGPQADCGLTGRKIVVDTYGGHGRHGGGAFSGKDPSKVDRSATYMARHIAKNVVAAGLAEVCEVQLAYAIGVADPISVLVDTEGTAKIDERRIEKLIRDHFPLRPGEIIDYLKLRRPIYLRTAAHGHFGRTGPGFTWEKTNAAKVLRAAAK